MNLQEFAALKPGDKITNDMVASGGTGTVAEVTEAGVRVQWGAQNKVLYTYTVNSTQWFHWSLAP